VFFFNSKAGSRLGSGLEGTTAGGRATSISTHDDRQRRSGHSHCIAPAKASKR